MSARSAARRRIIVLTFGLLSIHSIEWVFGSGCAPDSPGIGVSNGSVLNLTASGFSTSDLNAATAYWSSCGAGTDIPGMEVGGAGGIPVNVILMAGSSPTGRCGVADVQVGATSGRVVSATIRIYTKQQNGTSCQPFSDEIAHELGHVLGLADADSAACKQHIMGLRNPGTTRSVGPEDCDQVDQNWALPGEPPGGGAGGGGTPCV